MKKLIIIPSLLLASLLYGQESYFTTYNFTVAPEDNSTVYQLVNDYYSKNKAEGVTVYLYENHFNDSGSNFTHSIIFTGSLDAIGNMYGGGDNPTWDLFLTRLNQHITGGFSSAAGTRIASYGDGTLSLPIQRIYILDSEDGDAFEAGFRKFHENHDPAGIVSIMGNISLGVSPEGENRWVIVGFKDFKSALGGVNKMLSDAEKKARDKAWDEYVASNGGVKLIRSGLRVRLGSW
jgi:hypothetical protein